MNEKELQEHLGTQSLPDEIWPYWEVWVCEPIVDHMLAPRWAKAVLSVTGDLLDKGIDIKRIVEKIRELDK